MPLYRISDKLIFFVHIPKTGGTSMERALEAIGKASLALNVKDFPAPSQHFHAAIYDLLLPASFYDYAFTVCRNPYTRMISEYRHQFSRGKNRGLDFDAWIARSLRLYRKDTYVHHNHIRPQVEYLSATVEIFCYENGLQSCLDTVMARCGLKIKLELQREKLFDKQPITIKKKSLQSIASFYQQDFEQLNYDINDLSFATQQNITIR